jgi:hypothetical protein
MREVPDLGIPDTIVIIAKQKCTTNAKVDYYAHVTGL